jgi:hypothetical protein
MVDSTRFAFLSIILAEEKFWQHMNQILEDRATALGGYHIIAPKKARKPKRVKAKNRQEVKDCH